LKQLKGAESKEASDTGVRLTTGARLVEGWLPCQVQDELTSKWGISHSTRSFDADPEPVLSNLKRGGTCQRAGLIKPQTSGHIYGESKQVEE
jgi:hypothetical protein